MYQVHYAAYYVYCDINQWGSLSLRAGRPRLVGEELLTLVLALVSLTLHKYRAEARTCVLSFDVFPADVIQLLTYDANR